MSEDDTRKARQRKRTSQSKRFVAPDNIPAGQAWIGAPPKAKIPQSKNPSGPPGTINAGQPPANKPGGPPMQQQYGPPGPQGPRPQQQGGPQQMQQGGPQQGPPQGQMAQGRPPQQGAVQMPQGPPQQQGAPMPQQMQQQRPAQQAPYPQQAAPLPQQLNPASTPPQKAPLQQKPNVAPQQQQQGSYNVPPPAPQVVPVAQPSNQLHGATYDLNLTPVPKNTGGLKKTGSAKKPGTAGVVPVSRRARRVTKNWYWPEEDGNDPAPVPTVNQSAIQPAGQPASQPLGLLNSSSTAGENAEPDKNKSAFARAIDDYDVSAKPVPRDESEKFSQIAEETLVKTIGSDVDARAALDRLARSLASKAVTRELIELSPRVAGIIKSNKDLLSDFIELCRAGERARLSNECVTKVFEQLNRLYDAAVLAARRDLAVEHFLRAIGAALTLGDRVLYSPIVLCEHLLLSNHPDRAAEILLSIMTASKVNTEELGIRAFKFDRERAKIAIKISRESLEPDAEMRRSENVLTHNYFSFIFSTVAINAALQDGNPLARYSCKKGHAQEFTVNEQEVKPGVFKVVPTAVQDFAGLSYDQLAWVNRQFAGQKYRGRTIPDRLKLC